MEVRGRWVPRHILPPPPLPPPPPPPPPPLPPPPPEQEGGDFNIIPSRVFIGVLAFIFLVLVPCPSSMQSSISTLHGSFCTLQRSLAILHQVPEGHVGVYWRGSAIVNKTTEPGFHVKLPWITHFEPIQVTLQTYLVKNIPCGTKGGVMINFEKTEVVYRLHKDYVYETLLNYGLQYDYFWIYDKIYHEINQLCSAHSLQEVYIHMFDQIGSKVRDAVQADCRRYAPGIEVISVHVTKPKIPDSIRQTFEQAEEERIKALITMEKQKVAEKVAISEAKKYAYVSKIQMKQKLMEKKSARKQEEISNAIYMAHENISANADFYRSMKEAEANMVKLTPMYLRLKFIEAIANNSKIFLGDKVGSMIFDQRILESILKDVAVNMNLEI